MYRLESRRRQLTFRLVNVRLISQPSSRAAESGDVWDTNRRADVDLSECPAVLTSLSINSRVCSSASDTVHWAISQKKKPDLSKGEIAPMADRPGRIELLRLMVIVLSH
jgi:hypothetical protein